MKVKLKSGVNLSSMDNYCGLSYSDWLALEQGKTVELEEINKFIKDKVEKVGAEKIKKQPKLKEEK
tara:strand:- start:1324 stop:1521 length:198 start_codon:yes stop_codon:yes gene_type:complete